MRKQLMKKDFYNNPGMTSATYYSALQDYIHFK